MSAKCVALKAAFTAVRDSRGQFKLVSCLSSQGYQELHPVKILLY